MMSFEQLRTYYPDHIPAAYKVHGTFGGTSLRFCHGLDRFSEDLDFDYFGADREVLREQFEAIARRVSNEGLPCRVAHDYRDNDNFCKMLFPDISKSCDLDDPG